MISYKSIKKPAKIVITLLLAAVLMLSVLPLAVNAEIDDDFESGYLLCFVKSEGIDSVPGTVEIAFNENVDSENVTEIKIPDSVSNDGKTYIVSEITDSAFTCCTNLETLDLSECTSLEVIGMSAFFGCEKLSTIKIRCDFQKLLFTATGIVPDGDSFTVEYAVAGGEGGGSLQDDSGNPGGTFVYIHNWEKGDDTNHKCTRCETNEAHKWEKVDGANHKCSVCGTTGAHNWEKVDDTNHKCSGCGTTEAHNWEQKDHDIGSGHICRICSAEGLHNIVPDTEDTTKHKCTVCGKKWDHYGDNTIGCSGYCTCQACGAIYLDEKFKDRHDWAVMPNTIGNVSAEYKCSSCQKAEIQQIKHDDCVASREGENLKVILQDPYKVLPEGMTVRAVYAKPGSDRYKTLKSAMDAHYISEHDALFDIELFNAKGEHIGGEIAGNVRVLVQVPGGWDKNEIEVLLITSVADIEFEESIITIDGVDYVAFWTNHFSPYVLIDKMTEEEFENSTNNEGIDSPDTGDSGHGLFTAFAVILASSAAVVYIVSEKKRTSSKRN